MEERSNKTIICSVLFLDIVEYSRKSVSGQISLKDRFNSYLSAAIQDVPVTDRIILDTGDGAAINFLGDVEDALKAALSLRESLLNEDPDVDYPLLVRMGINLGPVRLVRDINGQPNIVGDGINVAQRVMGFADVAQILVSRSYYDAVSRLSPQYAGMFHYQGSRTDKHVREHEVYAIGYPGDKTTLRSKASVAPSEEPVEGFFARITKGMRTEWHLAIFHLDALIRSAIIRFKEAQPRQRALYVGLFAAPFVLLVVLLVIWIRHAAVPAESVGIPNQAEIPALSAVPTADSSLGKESSAAQEKALGATPAQRAKPPNALQDKQKDRPKNKPIHAEVLKKSKAQAEAGKKPVSESLSGGTEARILVTCTVGTEVFVDGVRKGSVGSKPLAIVISPGGHTVIVSHTSGGIFSQEVHLSSGKTVEIRPNFCK